MLNNVKKMNPNDLNQGVPPVVPTNPPTTSPQVPTEPPHHKSLLLILVLTLIVVLIGSVSYLWYDARTNNQSTEPGSQAVSDVAVKPFVPTDRGFYLVEYEGEDAIFAFGFPDYPQGYLMTHPFYRSEFDLTKISNASLILSSERYVSDRGFTNGFVASRTEGYVYLALRHSTDPRVAPADVQQKPYQIIRVNITTGEIKLLYSYDPRDNSYPENGSLRITGKIKNWLTLVPANCDECDGGYANTVAIINTDNGNFKYLGAVGNIQVSDTNSNTISYQKLESYEVPCTLPDNQRGDVGPCQIGDLTETKWRPAGPTITVTLK